MPHQTPVNPPTGHVSVGMTTTGTPNYSLRGVAGAPLPAIGWTIGSPIPIGPGNDVYLPQGGDLLTTAGVWAFGCVIRATASVAGDVVAIGMWAESSTLTWISMVLAVEDDTGNAFFEHRSDRGARRQTYTNTGVVYTWYFEGMAEFSGPGFIWPAVETTDSGVTGTLTIEAGSHAYISPVS